jgi:hypothetical protein
MLEYASPLVMPPKAVTTISLLSSVTGYELRYQVSFLD